MAHYRSNSGYSECQGSSVSHHLANPGSLEWFVVPVWQIVCQSERQTYQQIRQNYQQIHKKRWSTFWFWNQISLIHGCLKYLNSIKSQFYHRNKSFLHRLEGKKQNKDQYVSFTDTVRTHYLHIHIIHHTLRSLTSSCSFNFS